MNKTLVFTATYNEVNNIEILVKKIAKCSKNVDILVIDDNSPDGTKKVLFNLKKKIKKISFKIRKKKLGLDTAHKFAYKFAKQKKYLNLITLDADLSHDPIEINKMIKLLKKNEFVIGSRYVPGGRCDMSLPRLILSIMGNKLIRFLLKINCREFTTSYRGFNLKKLKNFDLKKVKVKGYSFFMETIYLLEKNNFKIYEIPINFKNRKFGKSKIPTFEIIRTLFRLINLSFNKYKLSIKK